MPPGNLALESVKLFSNSYPDHLRQLVEKEMLAFYTDDYVQLNASSFQELFNTSSLEGKLNSTGSECSAKATVKNSTNEIQCSIPRAWSVPLDSVLSSIGSFTTYTQDL